MMREHQYKKAGIPGSILVLIGIAVTITSFILNSVSETNFILFIAAGVGIALYGLFKLKVKKADSTLGFPPINAYNMQNANKPQRPPSHAPHQYMQYGVHNPYHNRAHAARINHPMFAGYHPHQHTVKQVLAYNNLYQNQVVTGYPVVESAALAMIR